MASRLRTHLRWRLDNALRSRGLQLVQIRPDPRIHALAPDEFELRGVRLDLAADWVTPSLRAAIYDSWYEEPEAQTVEATMRRDDCVLEVGCGVGFIATIASRISQHVVRCYDANPAMVAAARSTLARNAASAVVTTAVLQHEPTVATTPFFIHEDFWWSSLTPHPQATEITVPVLDVVGEITDHHASYLVVDIEGGETTLLLGRLPTCVRKLCVECHPAVSTPAAITRMLISLLSEGFTLSLAHSRPPVLYFDR
jgi:FkbM family methyltransferase